MTMTPFVVDSRARRVNVTFLSAIPTTHGLIYWFIDNDVGIEYSVHEYDETPEEKSTRQATEKR